METAVGRISFKCQHADILLDVVSVDFGWWFPEDPAEEPSLHGVWKSNVNSIFDDDPRWCDPFTGAWPMRAMACRVYKSADQDVG